MPPAPARRKWRNRRKSPSTTRARVALRRVLPARTLCNRAVSAGRVKEIAQRHEDTKGSRIVILIFASQLCLRDFVVLLALANLISTVGVLSKEHQRYETAHSLAD